MLPSALLMVRPARFYHNPETAGTNAFQSVDPGFADRTEEAYFEFDRMVEDLTAVGVQVLVFQSRDEGSPDSIFPNNWFISFPDGRFFLCPMLAPNRRRERSEELISLLQTKIGFDRVEDWSTFESGGEFLEGTGSIVYDHAGKVAYAAKSPRTDGDLFNRLCYETGYAPVLFDSYGRNGTAVYHTNVVLHIGERYAVFCEDSIADRLQRQKVRNALESGGRKVIGINLEQMEAFAGNMLQVAGHGGALYTVCSKTAYDRLSSEQLEEFESFTRLLPVSIPVIEQTGGGSARCMLAELYIQKTGSGN